MKRVVVTGIGVITPIGKNCDEFWNSLKNGIHGIAPIKRFDASEFKVNLSAEIKDFNAGDFIDKVVAKKVDRFTQYALIATKEAMEDSGISGNIDNKELSVYYGSGVGGMETLEENHSILNEKGSKRVSPLCVPKMILNIAAGNIAMTHKAEGACIAINTACASGTSAIGEAYRAIKDGYTLGAICGGAEAAITPLPMAGFVNCQALSLSDDPDCASVPFDKRRKGFIMGEGAGTLVLEEYEHAKKRGAKIYGEVVGYGSTCDAYHITAPSPEATSSSRAIEIALSGCKDIDAKNLYLNAHGTGTPMNDKVETFAIKKAFGDSSKDLNISSTKSMTGHMLGAAGAVEGIAVLLAMKENTVPPTINLKEQDEECDLNYTPNVAKEVEILGGLSTSLGFGGHNACIAFKKI